MENQTVTAKKRIFSGIQPTGNLTLGNYIGALRNFKLLEDEYDCLYSIVDLHALTVRQNPAELRRACLRTMAIFLASGLDPEKNIIYFQSQVAAHAELAWILDCFTYMGELSRMTQFKDKSQKHADNINAGLFTYPVLMASDILLYQADLVPVGEDQLPMLEQAREIVRRFNELYGETLVEPTALLPDNAACLRLPGTDGKAKMSKSLGNCIYLSDEPEDIKKKIMSMYTDPNHLRVQDPGKVEGNPVFIYLDAFCRPEHFAEFWPEYQNLDEVKAHYQRGGLGDVKVKKFLNSVMQAELEPIRTRRKEWEQRLPEVVEILKEGSAYAEKTAAATLADVRRSMRIDYFDNDNLLK